MRYFEWSLEASDEKEIDSSDGSWISGGWIVRRGWSTNTSPQEIEGSRGPQEGCQDRHRRGARHRAEKNPRRDPGRRAGKGKRQARLFFLHSRNRPEGHYQSPGELD